MREATRSVVQREALVLVHYMGDTFASRRSTVRALDKASEFLNGLSNFFLEQSLIIKNGLHISSISHDLLAP